MKLLSTHKWLIVGALVVAVAITLFCQGYITEPGITSKNDVATTFCIYEAGNSFNQWFQTWSSEGIFNGPMDGICYPLFSPLYFVMAKTYIPPPSIFLYVLFLFAGISCYLIIYYYTRNIYGSIAAGIFYSVNWFFISTASGPPFIMAAALFPTLFFLFDRVLEKGRFRDMAFFSLFTLIYVTSVFYHAVYVAFFFLALYALFHIFLAPGKKLLSRLFSTAKSSIISVTLILGLVAYELMPFFNGVIARAYSKSHEAAEVTYYTQPMAQSFFMLHGPDPIAPLSNYLLWGIVIIALALSAILFRRNKYTIFFTIAAVIGIFLSKGPHPPLAFIFNWLWDYFPGFNTFRDAGRWLLITNLCYAFLLGVATTSISHKLRDFSQSRRGPAPLAVTFAGISITIEILSNKLKSYVKFLKAPTFASVALVGILIAVIFLTVQLIFSGFDLKGFDPNRYPQYVETKEAYSNISSQDEAINSVFLVYKSVLFLDETLDAFVKQLWQTTQNPIRWLYPEGEQPITGLLSLEYCGELSQFSRFMDSHIQRVSMADFSGALGSENIKYIITDKLSDWRYPDFFQKNDNFDIFYEGETLTVFENKKVLPHLHAAPASAKLLGGFDSLLALPTAPNFSFKNINFLLSGSSQNADLLILYNTSAEDFALLNAAEYGTGVQSLDTDKSTELAWWRAVEKEQHELPQDWFLSDFWTVKGHFIHGHYHLRTDAQATIKFPFSVDESGEYEMWLRIAFASDRGKLQASVDGEQLPGFPLTPEADFDYGFEFVKAPITLQKGQYVLELGNDGSGYNDVDEVFLIKRQALESLFPFSGSREDIVYYNEAERLLGLDSAAGWSVSNFVRHGEIIAGDEQSQFWEVWEPDVISISDSIEPKAQGKDSLKIEAREKERINWTILSHYYDDPQDWSDRNYISFLFYGKRTGKGFTINFHSEDEGTERIWGVHWYDKWSGWKEFTFSIDKEALDWSKVSGVSLVLSKGPIAEMWYLDDLRVSKITTEAGVTTVKSEDEVSSIKANFKPIKEGEYTVFIRALATELEEVTEYVSVISTIADDEQSQFWEVAEPHVVSISDSAKTNIQGEDSLAIKVSGERTAWTLLQHTYDATQDWSDFDELSLQFYGLNSGQRFEFEAQVKEGDEWKVKKFTWTDDFTGWKHLNFIIDKEALDWSRVGRIKIIQHKTPVITGTWYLDGLTLITQKQKTIQVGTSPEDTKLHITINGQNQTFSGFTTEFKWLEAGPVSLDDSFQTIELSNQGEVLIDKLLLYPCESQPDTASLFEIDNTTSLTYDKLSPTKYEIHVNSDKSYWLVFSEIYHPLWYAHIDGETIQSTETYLGLNSFYVSKTGEYDFTLEFKGQEYLNRGAKITFATLGFIVIGVIFSEVWSRRKGRSQIQ